MPNSPYQILLDPQGDLVLMINVSPEEDAPDGAMFIYDGSDTALLFRNFTSVKALRNISPETGLKILEANDIFVTEIADGEIVKDYAARIRIVKDVNALIQQ